MKLIFIETDIFTEDVKALLSDDEYAEFQSYLAENPLIGDVIQQTGGLRKVRWSAKGKGKQGGVRVIYYYVLPDSQIRLLLIYQKGKQDDLTPEQKKILRQLNERWQ
ncbi:type II toxin-antitoxin system RelE/ParE family toxin [Fastidiosibacter lacustris]|uniref:type II toxin-antitoxin system RelE/ParE family toxin n=1 Tax=Fastidiosibacter lacustris TaxID=2056695 RepID=UPI001EFDF248|nr:type II toxin-antitoxin system RelE/ParE family toxin [Fastidiosibacter lacustris]